MPGKRSGAATACSIRSSRSSRLGRRQPYPGGGVTTGYLALVGGDEFKPGNEPHDRLLVEHRHPGTAFVVPTAAARQRPDLAVATAQQWFKSLGLHVVELPVLKRSDASSAHNVELAETGGLFYLTGGDPGRLVDVLHDSPVWRAISAAWRRGAALAGSSAGAMALGEWTLIRSARAYPGSAERRYKPALSLVPRIAVAPHFETFGHRWVDPVLVDPPVEDVVIVGIDERSAAVWDGHAWTARGPGRITLITRRARDVYLPGRPVPLAAP
jgi:cyanophycinase